MQSLPWPASRIAKSSASGDRGEFRRIRSFFSVVETLHFARCVPLFHWSEHMSTLVFHKFLTPPGHPAR
jgi:hypothetical protein